MEIDSPSSSSESDAPIFSPKDRILKRLALIDVPEECLKHMQPGIITYVKNVKRNRSRLEEIFNAILPSDDEIQTAIKAEADPSIDDLLQESMVWLQWLMFDGDPVDVLQRLESMNVGQRGVCEFVWGYNDIAYRCRTCENDPTCAICVPCFAEGDHKDHDYSVIYTGGGCCDCGDETAWKRSGFCSKHKGAEQMQPLQEDVANTLRPVLDYLFRHWKNSLLLAEHNHQNGPFPDDNAAEPETVADVLTSAVVGMLLDFCNRSESLLSFVSGRLCYEVDLLDVLVRAETFLCFDVFPKLQELLLKLISDPFYKYEFAKAFIKYYPTVVNEALKDSTDAVFKKRPLLSTFSVQIFTVPTLTPRLVKEMDLLTVLLECLSKIFSSCSGQFHQLQVSKWENLLIRFVMSQTTIPEYMTHERRDIYRKWVKLLAFVQGMNPQKRETNVHIEENENINLPFVLGHSIANIHALLVAGAFSTEDESVSAINKPDIDERESSRLVKVGRLSQESSVSSLTARGTSFDCETKVVEQNADSVSVSVLTSVSWLIFECLRSIEYWLKSNSASGGLDYTKEFEVLSSADWPEIEYDVSSQDVSIHIPLDRLPSLVLRQALKRCYSESEPSADSSTEHVDFFGHVLGGCHPYGFSGFIMEHPLRIRVFCSEVQAGMWRKNGDDALLSYEWYRSVRWSEHGSELDLFLLQCCAALAPADLYITRIVKRFGLETYLSLDMEN